MRTCALSLLGLSAILAGGTGCGGSAECGPGTIDQDGTCVVADPGGVDRSGGDDGAEDLGADQDGMDPAEPGAGEDPGAEPGAGGDPGAGGEDPAGQDPGAQDPGAQDPGAEDPGGGPAGEPAVGCDAAGDCSALGRAIFDAINAARLAAGEGACGGAAFGWSDGAATVALGHAAAMAAAGEIMAEDPAGGIGDRMDAAGVGFSTVGEVYGRAHGTPAEVVEAWMGNERLRAYLVSCEYALGGIGAAVSANGGDPYLTGTFFTP